MLGNPALWSLFFLLIYFVFFLFEYHVGKLLYREMYGAVDGYRLKPFLKLIACNCRDLNDEQRKNAHRLILLDRVSILLFCISFFLFLVSLILTKK